ncbi:MAG: hypothetical protein ACTHOH_07825 [Lysobacteraceae bacterium]
MKTQVKALSVSCLCVLASLAVVPASAEDSEKETPKEEQEAKRIEADIPQAVIDHMAYVEELQARFEKDPKMDVEALLAEEGEKAALLYCRAMGFEGPCTIDQEAGETKFHAVDAALAKSASASASWWSWLSASTFHSVGVIAEDRFCAIVPRAPRPLLEIHMDDEDRRNNNSRSGWIGAVTSGSNTTWRFCRVDDGYGGASAFLPLAYASREADYAVLQLGPVCPPGSRSIRRFEDNEDWQNANWYMGNAYPNIVGSNTVTYYCLFEGNQPWTFGLMNGFPELGMHYGVFATSRNPYAIASGDVYQDDEDWFNINAWSPSPNTDVMGGGSNTWRRLIKVK